jgi:peroxiredoxin
LADYREHYQAIRAAGASLVVVSVDAPERSEAVRQALHLPFSVLCDTERRVVHEWDVYNPREKGVAKPAVFVIARDRTVRYGAVDAVSTRVPPSEIVRLLETAEHYEALRKLYIPGFADWFRAIRNSVRR